MKNPIKISLLLLVAFSIIVGCEKTEDKTSIVYRSIDKEFVLIKDVKTLQSNNDEISNHVDSILSGLINSTYITTGQIDFDLNADLIPDIGFDIISLNKPNPNKLPETLDSLGVRVIPLTVEILDNSTYGYSDALDYGEQISEDGRWFNSTNILGNFMNVGKFQGKGEKYLGIRFIKEGEYKYGWIKIYCSQQNDTLRIIEYAYNDILNDKIKAGQKE